MSEARNDLNFQDWFALTIATWFGSGLLPLMPGTWGTLCAIPLVVAMSLLLEPVYYVLSVILFALAAVPIAGRAAFLYRTRPGVMRLNPQVRRVNNGEFLQKYIKDPARQREDPGMIVIDEVVGYAVAMIAVPFSIVSFILAFLLFRFFDIVKVEPGKIIERLGNGLGIMLDDMVAGLYACLSMHLVLFLWRAAQLPAWP